MAWIFELLVRIGEEYGAKLSSAPSKDKSEKCQIKKFFDLGSENAAMWALVSDKTHYIAVKLTKEALNAYKMRHGRRITDACSFPVVILQRFKVVCTRIPKKYGAGLTAESFLALECDSVQLVESYGDTADESEDIYQEAKIQQWIQGLRQHGGAGNILMNHRNSAAPDLLAEYHKRWSEQISAPLDFVRESTLPPPPKTQSPPHSPVDARVFPASSPSQQFNSAPSSPLSGWDPTPSKQHSSSSSSPRTPQSDWTPARGRNPSPQVLLESAPRPQKILTRKSGDIDQTPRISKRRRTSDSPPLINRKVSRPPEPPIPTSSGPTVILAPNSEPSESQLNETQSLDEDDEQFLTLLSSANLPSEKAQLAVPLTSWGFAAIRRSLLLLSAGSLGIMSLRKPLAEWATFVYAKGDIRSLFGIVVCSIVVLILAYLTNPSENSFRSYLTEQSFRHHLSRLDATSDDQAQRRPSTSTIPFDHGSPFHFANRATVSLRTPKHVFHSFGVFTVAAIIPSRADRLPRRDKDSTIVTDSWFLGAFGKWYRGGVLDAWYQDVVARSSDEESWTSGIMGIKALDKLNEYDGLPFSTKNLPAARAPPKLRNRDKSSQRLPARSSTPPPLPKSASLPLHTPVTERLQSSTQSVNEPHRLASPALSRSPSTLFDQSPRIAEVLQQISSSRNSVVDLRNQLADFQISASASHSSLQGEVDSYRDRKRQEDAARSELKSRTKTLDDSKRAAESVKREADKRLKAAQTSRDDTWQRLEFLDKEIDLLTERRAQDEASLVQTQQISEPEQEIADALEHKKQEIRTTEDVIAALNLRARELEDRLASEKDRLKLARERAELRKQDRSFQPFNPVSRNLYDSHIDLVGHNARRSSDPSVPPTSPRPAKLALGSISNFNNPPHIATRTNPLFEDGFLNQHSFTNFSPFGDSSQAPALLSPTTQLLIPSGLISSLDSGDGLSRSFQSDSDAYIDKDWREASLQRARSQDTRQLSPHFGPLTASPTSLQSVEHDPFEIRFQSSPGIREREFRMPDDNSMAVYRTHSDPTSAKEEQYSTTDKAPSRRWFTSSKDKAKKGLNPDAKEFSLPSRKTTMFDALNPNGLGSNMMAPTSTNQSLLRAFAPSPAEREALYRALGGSTNTSLERLPSLSDVGSIPPSPAHVHAQPADRTLPSWLASLPRIRKPNFSPWEDEEPVVVNGEKRYT
ncbi:Proteophosphoglycan ppg4 [Mycena indigotica]|uniref:Proteophosphoglycan ppg4 n=1 Tax=Mycena indigotica TaxID=2126181 RepID=A0A8H6WF17_9AGAR|nr:Proteophosphoglycan ppg4 [Mycena indigotica]KAF7315377.1 Proteophosphoglycan ppg4 [Mycena indigotica]